MPWLWFPDLFIPPRLPGYITALTLKKKRSTSAHGRATKNTYAQGRCPSNGTFSVENITVGYAFAHRPVEWPTGGTPCGIAKTPCGIAKTPDPSDPQDDRFDRKERRFDLFLRTVCPSMDSSLQPTGLENFTVRLDLGPLKHEPHDGVVARLLGSLKGRLQFFCAPRQPFG